MAKPGAKPPHSSDDKGTQGIRSDLGVRVAGNRCPFCHDDVLSTGSVACQECLARHHSACWDEGQECSACGATVKLAAGEEAVLPAKTKRKPGLLLLAIALLIGISFFGLVFQSTSSSPREVSPPRAVSSPPPASDPSWTSLQDPAAFASAFFDHYQDGRSMGTDDPGVVAANSFGPRIVDPLLDGLVGHRRLKGPCRGGTISFVIVRQLRNQHHPRVLELLPKDPWLSIAVQSRGDLTERARPVIRRLLLERRGNWAAYPSQFFELVGHYAEPEAIPPLLAILDTGGYAGPILACLAALGEAGHAVDEASLTKVLLSAASQGEHGRAGDLIHVGEALCARGRVEGLAQFAAYYRLWSFDAHSKRRAIAAIRANLTKAQAELPEEALVQWVEEKAANDLTWDPRFRVFRSREQ